jgi:hypothetical protein
MELHGCGYLAICKPAGLGYPSSEAQRAVGYLGRTNRWTYKCCHSTTALQLGGRGSVTTHSAVNEVHMISVRR